MTTPTGKDDFKVTTSVSTWLCDPDCPFLETRQHHLKCQQIPNGSTKKYALQITEPQLTKRDVVLVLGIMFLVLFLGIGIGSSIMVLISR